jgi:hypothetical protein
MAARTLVEQSDAFLADLERRSIISKTWDIQNETPNIPHFNSIAEAEDLLVVRERGQAGRRRHIAKHESGARQVERDDGETEAGTAMSSKYRRSPSDGGCLTLT